MWIDIVFIAIIIIFAIIGLVKGLFDSILSLCASVASIFLSFWASKPVAEFLNKLVDVNGFFRKFLENTLKVPETGVGGHTLDQLASVCTIVLSMIIVFVLIKAAVWLLAKLFDSVSANSTALSGMNRLFGLIFGAVQGFAVVLIILGLTSIASMVPAIDTKVNNFLDKSNITRHTYNYVNEWVNDELKDKIDDFINDLSKEDPTVEEKVDYAEKAKTETNNESFVVTATDTTVSIAKVTEKQYENVTVTLTYSSIKLYATTDTEQTTQIACVDGDTAITANALTPETSYTITFTVTFTSNATEPTTATQTYTLTFTTTATVSE